ncbi:MAG: hypothetical protein WCR33_03120, partial [Bacilli bacterium]
YILTEDSITESSFIGTDANGNYMYYYAVDTAKALTDYSKEIKYRSGSSITPEFEYANMTITMTDQAVPLTIRYNEKYKLKVVVNVTCVLDNTETFSGFGDSKIDEDIGNIFMSYVNPTNFTDEFNGRIDIYKKVVRSNGFFILHTSPFLNK